MNADLRKTSLGIRTSAVLFSTAAHAVVLGLFSFPEATRTPMASMPAITARLVAEPFQHRAAHSKTSPSPRFRTPATDASATPPAVPTTANEPPSEPDITAAATTDPAAAVETPTAATAPWYTPDYLSNPPPVYPALSRRLGEQGQVLLYVLVGADGHAREVRLHASSGFARLDRAAVETVRDWQFAPARSGILPVAAPVLVPVSFMFDG